MSVKHYLTESLSLPGYPVTVSVVGDMIKGTPVLHTALKKQKNQIHQSDINTLLWTTGKIRRVISQKSLNYCDSLYKVLLTLAQ